MADNETVDDRTVDDWMAAAFLDDEDRVEEELSITRDMAGTVDLGALELRQIIQDLGPYLGAEDLTVVARALALLPVLLATMETELVSHDIHLLVEYLCARLRNEENIPTFRAGLKDIASTLKTMAGWKTFPASDAAVVINSVFGLARGASTLFMDQRPDTRSTFYELTTILFREWKRALERDVGYPALIEGLVDLAKPEKNAVCLSELFVLYAGISSDYDRLEAAESEKLFELFVRYYPISLPEALDSTMPSSEDLQNLLFRCFVSSDKYADNTFDLLITGMDTDQKADKKLEVMKTMRQCAKSYSTPKLVEQAPKIWSALSFEIWHNSESRSKDFVEESLNILSSLFITIRQKSRVADEECITKLVAEIINEIYDKMSNSKQFMASCGKILRTIASSSHYVFYLVTKNLLPKLDVLAQTVEAASEKKSVLVVYNNLLQSRLDLPGLDWFQQRRGDQMEGSITDTLLVYRQSIVDVYFGVMSNGEISSAFGTAAIEGLVLLTKIPGFLSPAEEAMVLQTIDGVFRTSSHDDEIHAAALDAIRDMSSRGPTTFSDLTLPNLMNLLPTKLTTDSEEQKSQLSKITKVLEDLREISCKTVTGPNEILISGFRQQNFDPCMQSLIQLWQSLVDQNGQLAYSNLVLGAILLGVEAFDKANDAQGYDPTLGGLDFGQYGHVVVPLFARSVQLKQLPSGPHYIGLANANGIQSIDEKSIELIGKIATCALRAESRRLGKNFLVSWNEQHDHSAIWSLFCTAAEGVSIVPAPLRGLKYPRPEEDTLVSYLSAALVAGMSPKDKNNLMIDIGDSALTILLGATNIDIGSTKLADTSMLWLFQLLVTKFDALNEPLTGESRSFVQVMVDFVEDSASSSPEEAAKTYRTLAYFTAVTIASHKPETLPLLDLMIKGVSDPRIGRKVAQSFRMLLEPSDIINEDNFCAIRRLRKARVATLTVMPLLDLWRASRTDAAKDNALIALAGVLAYLPESLRDNVDTLLPALLQGTNIQGDKWAKHAFLTIIATLLPICPGAFENHLDSLIDRMTDRTHNTLDSPSDSPGRCRIAALDVMTEVVQHMPSPALHRIKFKVMDELDVAVEDCSSPVRAKAVQCKLAWFQFADAE